MKLAPYSFRLRIGLTPAFYHFILAAYHFILAAFLGMATSAAEARTSKPAEPGTIVVTGARHP